MTVPCEVSFDLIQSLVNKEVSTVRSQFFSIPAYLNKQLVVDYRKILGTAAFVCGVMLSPCMKCTYDADYNTS